MKLKAKEGKRLKLAIGTNIQNYSRDEDFNSYKNNQVIINSDKDFNEITTDFSILETPEWWFTINQKTENEIGKSDYSKVHYINISNCLSIPLDKEDHIEIEELIFYKSLVPFILYAVVGCLAYYIFLFFLFRKKEKAVVPVQFTYEKTEVLNHFEKEEEAVFQYITSNYSNPELSILDVVNATGIYEQKVSSMIKKKTEMNFKQFLNSLRIAEAKRLLKTSDLQISEIAYKVGYGNVSHFNRVFKESEQCSPNDFRKQDQKSTIS
ncbi:MAG: AraC family transcriptional regulator [Sporocytophaga sp.]|nr:AraC family transcriptional regulator [Sporocytophaga sp.]